MNVPLAGFVGGAYTSKSWKASAQRCVNFYVEQDPERGNVLYGTPGLGLLASLGGLTSDRQVIGLMPTPRGLIVSTENRLIHIASISTGSDGTITLGATKLVIGNFGAPCSSITFAQAGDQFMAIAIYSSGSGSISVYGNIDGSGIGVISDADYPSNAMTCTAVDGLFIAHGRDSDQFFWSAPFDPTSWNALDFASAENLSDSL